VSTRTALVAALLLLIASPATAAGASQRGAVVADSTAGSPSPPAAGGRDGAAEAPDPDELVALALRNSPSVAALEARVQQAQEMVRPAGAPPDPMVGLMIQDVGFPKWTVGEEDMSMVGPEITQGIPFPGKRGARRRAAQAEVAVRADELDRLRREVARDVRALYARLYALDQERGALSSGRELLEMLAATVRDRYAAGVAEQEAAVKAQLAESRLAERLDDLVAERKGLVAALNRILDQPGDAPLGRVTALPEPQALPLPWEAAVVGNSAEVALGRAEVQAAERRLEAARRELWPDLVAGAGLGLRGGKDPAVTFRMGLDLPLWSAQKQGPMIRAAERDLEAARQSLREAEAAARAEAARLEAEWQKTDLQLARYGQAIVPQSSLALDAARAGYLAGRGDFSTVVEDFNLWLEARAGLARRQAERFETWAQLQSLVGASGGPQENGTGRER